MSWTAPVICASALFCFEFGTLGWTILNKKTNKQKSPPIVKSSAILASSSLNSNHDNFHSEKSLLLDLKLGHCNGTACGRCCFCPGRSKQELGGGGFFVLVKTTESFSVKAESDGSTGWSELCRSSWHSRVSAFTVDTVNIIVPGSSSPCLLLPSQQSCARDRLSELIRCTIGKKQSQPSLPPPSQRGSVSRQFLHNETAWKPTGWGCRILSLW